METGGTGLGLSIVKHGAILHDAKIKIESTLGTGTRLFEFYENDNEDGMRGQNLYGRLEKFMIFMTKAVPSPHAVFLCMALHRYKNANSLF